MGEDPIVTPPPLPSESAVVAWLSWDFTLRHKEAPIPTGGSVGHFPASRHVTLSLTKPGEASLPFPLSIMATFSPSLGALPFSVVYI